MSSRPELPPESIEWLEGLEWQHLPNNRGQMVSISYAVSVYFLHRRTHNNSSGETTYDRAEIDHDNCHGYEWEPCNGFDPHNGLLPNHGEWEACE